MKLIDGKRTFAVSKKGPQQDLLKKHAEFNRALDKLVSALNHGTPGAPLRKAAADFGAKCMELSEAYGARRAVRLQGLDPLDRSLVEKGGFSFGALRKMSVVEKACALAKIADKTAATEDD